ncbi:MAG: porin [Gammaproteobacteria bacterium]|nr:porin [Gammaproteobacteria bacterium]
MKRVVSLSGLVLAGLMPLAAQALDNVAINGFLTAGATYGDSEVPLQDGSFGNEVSFTTDSRIGIQLLADVNSNVSVTSQLFARADEEAYNMSADWAFVTYKVNDPLSFRMGKIKLTTFLISDYYDVGYAYPWIRPPMEVYSSNPIETISGADILYRLNFGDNQLLIQPYFGDSHGEEALQPQETLYDHATQSGFIQMLYPGISPGAADAMADSMPLKGDINFVEFEVHKMRGINIALSSNIFTVRAGYLKTLVSAESFGVEDEEAEFASVGFTVDWKNVVIYSEYFERDITGLAQLAFPDQKGSYVTLGYRTGRLLTHVTQAKTEDNDSPATATHPIFGPLPLAPLEQESTTVGFRYELGAGAAMKFEVQNIKPKEGTRGLLLYNPNDPSTNKDPSDSINIYSFAIDVVF